MATIFLSHSSKDNETAAALAERLREQGYTSVFLDFDPEDGIPAGREWERELYHRLRVCRAMIVLCSEHSMHSQWCFAEVTHAKSLGKHVIPVRVDDCDVAAILKDRQVLELARDAESAYERLWRALREQGLDPGDVFDWDATRPPYPGLLAFQEADAGVFFGRNDAIREGLDALNRLRNFGAARLLLVLGASGSGKSSLVRAGLLPRLRRDPERWFVLDPFRPLGDPVGELAAVLQDGFARHDVDRSLDEIRTLLRRAMRTEDPEERLEVLRDLARDLRRAAKTPEARILLTLDQTEELLGAEGGAETPAFLVLLRALLECQGWRAITTLRSDYLGELQRHPALRELAFESLPLGPLTANGLRHVIAGPADVAALDIEPALIDALVEDAEAQDALPLLAFALRETWEHRGRIGRMRLDVYRNELGGLSGAVARAAEEVMAAARPSEEDEDALREAFLAMTRLSEDGRYARRASHWSEVEEKARPLLQRFVDGRLLMSWGEGDVALVEVAHEALFSSWDRLAHWLDENRDLLRTRSRVEASTRRWLQEGRHRDFLLPAGRPLSEGEVLLAASRLGLGDAEREFLKASVAARDAAQAEAQEAEERRQRRKRQLLAASVGAIVLAIGLGVSLWMWLEARRARGDAVQERDLATAARSDAEDARKQAVREKGLADTARLAAVQERQAADVAKGEAVEARGRAEAEKETADRAKEEAEAARRQAEAEKETADRAKDDADAARRQAETEKKAADAARADAEAARAQTETLRRAHRARSLAMQEPGGSPAALVEALRAVVPDLAEGRPPHPEAEAALRLAVKRMERSLPLLGHEGAVARAAFSPDGRRVVTASEDGTARIWDAVDGRTLLELTGHALRVFEATFSPDGSLVATASADRTARIWDANQGTLLLTLEGHRNHVADLAFSPDGRRLLTASWDTTACVWDTESGALLHTLAGHQGPVMQCAFDATGTLAATASTDGSVRIWRPEDGASLHTLDEHARAVLHLDFSDDGDRLLSSSADRTVCCWDPKQGELVHTLRGHEGPVKWAEFSPDASHVVTASSDGTARVWDAADGSLLHTLDAHEGEVDCATFSPDGTLTCTACEDGDVHVWTVADGALLRTLDGHVKPVREVAFAPDGSRIVSASEDQTARVYRIEDGALLRVLEGHRGDVRRVAFSPAGDLVATASTDNTARVWRTEDGALRHVLEDHAKDVRGVGFAAGGTRVVTAADDGVSRIWDIADGALLHRLPGHTSWLPEAGFAISQDGSRFVTASGDGTALVWNVHDGTQAQRYHSYDAAMSAAAISPDGSRVILATAHGTVDLRPVAPPLRTELVGHVEEVHAADFSPNGTMVATGSYDGTARIWSAVDGRLLHTLQEHDFWVENVRFSPDNRLLVTTSSDDTARVWRTEDGAELYVLPHAHDVKYAEFSPDVRRLVTASWDGTVRLWSAKDGLLLDEFERHGDYFWEAVFSPDGRRLATASNTACLWSVGIEDLVARALRLAAPYRSTLKLAARERVWLDTQDVAVMSRSAPSRWVGRLAKRSVLSFHDSLEAGLEEARASDKLVYAVLSRYDPP